jgi:hypothetical protein
MILYPKANQDYFGGTQDGNKMGRWLNEKVKRYLLSLLSGLT